MKRVSGLWRQITSEENLWLAFRRAAKGKRARSDVARFCLDAETELRSLKQELIAETWRPGPFRHFQIYDRKPRLISAAPFRDRVVHHAVMNLVEPQIDRHLVATCFACRAGKGVHLAVNYYQNQANRFAYVLKVDVRKYFQSIDHEILYSELQKIIKEPQLLSLIRRIISHGAHPEPSRLLFPGDDLLTTVARPHGIVIGNLTSQVFANLYLNQIDHWIQGQPGVGGYLRYVDDLMILSDNKDALWSLHARMQERLEKLRLQLHERKMALTPTRCKVDVLGYQVSRKRRWLRNENGWRARHRLQTYSRQYSAGALEFADVRSRVQSWIGHAVHAETVGLRRDIFKGIVFARGCGHW